MQVNAVRPIVLLGIRIHFFIFMWFLLLCVTLVLLALFCWALAKGSRIIRIVVGVHGLIVSAIFGYFIGEGWQGMTDYGHYIRPFSEYSTHLRSLAENQQIAELTNVVILFDSRFNPRQDQNDLKDVLWQILKVGPYSQDSDTNITVTPAASNKSEIEVPNKTPSTNGSRF